MKKELAEIRKLMQLAGADIYITADADDHISEYSGPHFASMKFISGFTGGDGTLVIAKDEAGLWTDGRYFIQAAAELKDSGITLMKMGEPDCPDMAAWIFEHMPQGGNLCFDGRCISAKEAEKLIKKLRNKKISVISDRDLAGELWGEDRPKEPEEKLWILKEEYSGMSIKDKICWLKKELTGRGIDAMVVTALDEVAWLLNLRGNDVPCNPVFSSFLIFDVTDIAGCSCDNGACAPDFKHGAHITLYVSEGHLTDEVKAYLEESHISVCTDVSQVYKDVSQLKASSVLMNLEATSFLMKESVPDGTEIIDDMSPIAEKKCVKNPVETENLRKAQLKDSTAMTRFMYWFKKNMDSGELTECGTAEKLHALRAEEEGFLGDSFETISAYGENAAMCHYAPDPSRDVKVLSKGLYLCDSGGHYYEGSTDITRTWSCGPVTEEEVKAYTYTAMANLRLADSVFLDRTSGLTIDYPAREIYWKHFTNFNHGTGHGVGYLLNVHEGPADIRFRCRSHAEKDFFTEGTYCSDEPGFYVEGKFGVRLENMLLTVKACENGYGKFMKFEALTLVPFDRGCIDPSLMTEEDIALYNEYHKKVYEKISPRLNDEEAAWLKEMCAPISRE